ncbi:MAG: helix-turn-helix domain-containing protein [Spirochaetaceae bacterium]
MRSLSDVLIKQREEKGFTISQVAYETNISRKYIEALEEEEFDVFPAQAYLLGFLRNYSEFLGLEYDVVYGEYQNCLLREEPTPLSELMGVQKTFELRAWMIIVPILLLVLGFGIPPLVKTVGNQIEKRKEALRIAGEDKTKIFTIDQEYIGKKVKEGDSFTMLIGEDKLTYLIREISSDMIVTENFKGNQNDITLKLGNEVITQFSQNSKKYDITLFLKDIGGFSDNSAIIKIKSDIKDDVIFTEGDTPTYTDQSVTKDSKILMVKKRSTDPYTISIKFEGDILFKYQMKGQELIENFYQKNSSLNLDVTRSVKIWTSNAGLTKFKWNGEGLVLGRTGEVHVFTLRWLYNSDKDEYRLEYATAY